MSEKTILKLQLPTDPTWVKNVVESNIEELLNRPCFVSTFGGFKNVEKIVYLNY